MAVTNQNAGSSHVKPQKPPRLCCRSCYNICLFQITSSNSRMNYKLNNIFDHLSQIKLDLSNITSVQN